MTEINPPKDDRVGNDPQEDPKRNPGVKIDTSDSLVPPLSEPPDDLRPVSYEDRNRSRGERPEGPSA